MRNWQAFAGYSKTLASCLGIQKGQYLAIQLRDTDVLEYPAISANTSDNSENIVREPSIHTNNINMSSVILLMNR